MDALVGRTAVASQQLHQDGRPGHPVQHAHCCGLHPHVIRLNTNLQLRVCTSATYIYSTAARAKRAGGWVVPRTSGYTSLVPAPRPASRRLQYRTASDGKLGEGLGTRLRVHRDGISWPWHYYAFITWHSTNVLRVCVVQYFVHV